MPDALPGSETLDGPAVVAAQSRNPLASLCRTGILLTIGSGEFFVPYHSARVWLTLLFEEPPRLFQFLPGLLCDEDYQRMEEAFETGDITLTDLQDAWNDLITEVSGRDWWFTVRLLAMVREAWDRVGGVMVLRGVQPDALSLAEWLDAVWVVVLEHTDRRQVSSMVAQLRMPPEGVAVDPSSEDNDAAFFAAMNAHMPM